MKKTLKSFFVFVAAALTLVGCQKKEIEQPQTEGEYVYTFTIDDETRAVIGDSNIEWVAGDQVGIFIGSLGDYAGYKGYAKVDVTTTPKMVVLYSNAAIPAGAMAYAYAPYDPDNRNNDVNNAKIVVNNIQNGAEISAMPLAGLPFQVEEEIEAGNQNGNGQIKFMNLGSVVNFKIFSTNKEFQSETIQYIQFESTKTIAGIGHLDLTAVSMDDEGTLVLNMDTEENSVKVVEEMAVVADKESADPIKMVILPGTFEGVLTVVTDVATYTKAIPEREFARSHTRTFGLDLAKAEREEGGEVAKTLPYEESFASNQGDFTIENNVKPEGLSAVWTFDSGYSCMKATGYVDGTRYATESMLVSPWINLTSAVAAEITFANAYNYISAPADYLSLWVKTDDKGSDWVQVEIPNYGTGGFKWGNATVSLNDYAGKNVKIAFKYISGGTDSDTGTWEIKNFSAHIVKLDAEISYAVTEFEAVVDGDFAAPTLLNPNELTVTYSSSDAEIASVDETSGEVEIGSKTGTVTITATFAGNDDYKAATASYTITVTDPSVIAVWQKTASSDLATGDYVVIVDETSARAMSNDKGTSNPPSATSIAISGNYLASEPAATLQWIVTKNGEDYQFQVPSTTNYLYCISNNNGLRVGTNTDNKFAIVEGFLFNNAQERYVGVYNNQDWRSYTTINNNIKNTVLAFYKKTTKPADFVLSSIAITTAPSTTTFTVGDDFVFDGVVTATYSDGTTADVTGSITTNGEDVIATEGQNKTVTVSYTEGGVTATATYTVNVNPAQGGGEGGTVTFVAGVDTGATSVTKDGITVSMSTMSRTDNYRTYANTAMTVTSTVGNIANIEITCTGEDTSSNGPGLFSGEGYTFSGYTGTWTGSAKTVSLSASAQVRMTEITVTYE